MNKLKLEEIMADGTNDAEALAKAAKEYHEIITKIDEKTHRWLELADKL